MKFREYGDFKANHYVTDVALKLPWIQTHSQYEIYICLSKTRQTIVLGDKTVNIDYPCMCIVPPFEVHGMTVTVNERWDRYVYHVSSSFFSEETNCLLKENDCSKNVKIIRIKEDILPLLQKIADASVDVCGKSEEAYFLSDQKALLKVMLNKILTCSDKESTTVYNTDRKYITEVMSYIYEHASEELTADGIAEYFFVSRAKLNRDFKKYVGTTVREYVIETRLGLIKYLIVSRRYRTDEIIKMAGFSSKSYFFSFFKKNTGMTPSEYLNKTIDSDRQL